MTISKPRPISEAKMDGTKYIVWDKSEKDWVTAYYDITSQYWKDLAHDYVYNPTHFVEYLPDPTKED